jgi:PAS domain-containing protein
MSLCGFEMQFSWHRALAKQIDWVNQAELNMFGYDRSEYIGQPPLDFHVDRAKIADLLRRVSHNESVKNCEAQVY